MSSLFEGIADLLAAAPLIALAAGESRRLSSLPKAALLVVEEGFLVVYGGESVRRPAVLAEGGPGRIILAPRSGDILHAVVRSSVVAVEERLLAVPGVAQAVCHGLVEAVRLEQEVLTILSMPRHADRVRRKLIQLAREYGRVGTRGGVRVAVPLTHELLAEMVGSARETVSRAVEGLEREGFLVREGRFYRLYVSPEDLAAGS